MCCPLAYSTGYNKIFMSMVDEDLAWPEATSSFTLMCLFLGKKKEEPERVWRRNCFVGGLSLIGTAKHKPATSRGRRRCDASCETKSRRSGSWNGKRRFVSVGMHHARGDDNWFLAWHTSIRGWALDGLDFQAPQLFFRRVRTSLLAYSYTNYSYLPSSQS